MSDNEKSTDPGLSAAERKELRSREAKEAVADHEEAQQAFHANRERLRAERLAREAVAGRCYILHRNFPTILPSKMSDFP
jgi:hypothetical protein